MIDVPAAGLIEQAGNGGGVALGIFALVEPIILHAALGRRVGDGL